MSFTIPSTIEEFDRLESLSEKMAKNDAIRSNEAFAAAMLREIRRGRVKVMPGTFTDDSPTLARRIHGETLMSACGSPAAMCADSGGAPGGAATLK